MSTVTTIVNAPEAYVSSEAVQAHLNVSPRTLGNYRQRGLPHVVLSPRVFRYRLSEVDAWLDQQRTTALTP